MNAALFERTDRAFVRVYGRDPVKMVQGLITNDLLLATDTRAVSAGLLTPKGKLVAELRAYRRNDEILLETARAALDNLLAHFRKFVPPLFARFEVLDNLSLIGVYGPDSAHIVFRAFGIEAPAQEDDTARAGNALVIRTHYAGDTGFDVLVEGDTADARERLSAAGATAGDAGTLETMRIEAGTPEWGAELDENVIPLEAGLHQRMISQSKGCYTGQEVIIRILHRGHVNRHLRGLLLGDLDVPAKGTQLFNAGGKPVGSITSATTSPQLGQTIALGYARRELTLPASVHLGEANGPLVTVVELPFAPSTVSGAR